MKTDVRIVIPGGSGQIGTILARHFCSAGHDVTVLSRRQSTLTDWKTAAWSVDALDGADVVINLAGRSVNCRYDAKNRREILDSRVKTTQWVSDAIAAASNPPVLWLNSSTATIYRHALDRPMDETTGEIGSGFSVDVARQWEAAFFDAPAKGTRRVALRSAMVMSPDRGGVFDVLLRLVRFGLGGTNASGDQYVSWIHETDFVRAIDFLISRSDLDGALNICSPNPLPNRDFMRVLRTAWGARIGLPATRWMLEIGALVLGTETELILKSRRVVPGRLMEAGFPFHFPEWSEAATDLTRRWRSTTG